VGPLAVQVRGPRLVRQGNTLPRPRWVVETSLWGFQVRAEWGDLRDFALDGTVLFPLGEAAYLGFRGGTLTHPGFDRPVSRVAMLFQVATRAGLWGYYQ
jgi:hypothetical protein